MTRFIDITHNEVDQEVYEKVSLSAIKLKDEKDEK